MGDKGTAHYWDDERKAARQASYDLDGFAKSLAPASPEGGPVTDVLGAIWGGIGSLSSLGSLGVGISNLVLSRFPKAPDEPPNDAVEVQVVNNTSVPVVLFRWEAEGGNVTRIPAPLPTGGSDLVLFTNTDDGVSKGSMVKIDLLVGVGDDAVDLSVKYAYDGSRWVVHAGIDSDSHASHGYDGDLEIAAATFTAAPGTCYPSFSFYSGNIETTSGTMTLALYDAVTPPAPPPPPSG